MSAKKVVVIGLDGFEPKIVEPLLAAGELPNLAQLREHGGYSRLRTTAPALTPAAWSSFAVGTNPGGHGIFEFVHRDPRTYLPILALNRYEQKNVFLPPKAVNLRRGTPVWDILKAAGRGATVLRCPCTSSDEAPGATRCKVTLWPRPAAVRFDQGRTGLPGQHRELLRHGRGGEVQLIGDLTHRPEPGQFEQ